MLAYIKFNCVFVAVYSNFNVNYSTMFSIFKADIIDCQPQALETVKEVKKCKNKEGKAFYCRATVCIHINTP